MGCEAKIVVVNEPVPFSGRDMATHRILRGMECCNDSERNAVTDVIACETKRFHVSPVFQRRHKPLRERCRLYGYFVVNQ